MSKVIFVRGIQGSGKSTWAKAWVNEDSTHRVRISWDDIRRMLGPYWIPEREELVKSISQNMLLQAINNGYDVVIDNMNLSRRSTAPFKEITCYIKGLEVEYKDFKTPLEECLKRNAQRQGDERIADEVIINTYNKNESFYGID